MVFFKFTGPEAAKPLLVSRGPNGTKGIDAEVFIDDDGRAYMYWAQRGAARLKADMVTLDPDMTIIKTKRDGYSEGPFMVKRKGIYYYLYTLGGYEDIRIQSPHTDMVSVKARYLKYVFLKGIPGLWDLKVY